MMTRARVTWRTTCQPPCSYKLAKINLTWQEEKERKRQEAEDLANGIVKKPPRTKRSKANGGGRGGGGGYQTDVEPATATEAIEKMLKEKKISTKINYDVLK